MILSVSMFYYISLKWVLLNQFKALDYRLGFQERAWREHRIGSDATSVAHKGAKLVKTCRDALPVNMDEHGIIYYIILYHNLHNPLSFLHLIYKSLVDEWIGIT